MDFSGYGFDLRVRQHPAIPAKPSTAGNRTGSPVVPGYRTMEATFFAIPCNDLTTLAVLKSVLLSFIHGKMVKEGISFRLGNEKCNAQRRQKNGEKSLYFCLEQGNGQVLELYLDYQAVACLQVAIDKAIAFLPIEEVGQNFPY